MAQVTEERIHDAVEDARMAFWATIVEHFPEVETGDFDFGAARVLMRTLTQSVELWLQWNHPDHPATDAVTSKA